ncbi:MAG TPA: carbamoyltransferase N-terminal domain-containing protein, partial [Bryobacteraceae bacterium]|nr:carbamoyltransferase N-terminal domain-containing protein [Bryobacteraceae bacterium]
MNILGISGFENAMPFKKAHWPGLEEREYRISQGHDAAAALLINGVLVAAAAEERFDRQKHSARFPVHAISYCLSEAGISLKQIDELAHGFDYSPYQRIYSLDLMTAQLYEEVFSREALLAQVERNLSGFRPERIHHVGHHLAHAASAFFTSGWDDCLVAVVDAMGEAQSVSIFHGRDGRLDKLREISAQDSMGILYSLVTLHLGFDFNADEYKIMGLAPYGSPERFRAFFEQAVELCPDGSIRIPVLRLNRTREERENYTATRKYLDEHLVKERRPEDEITAEHRDVAAALQECLDRVMLHVCGHFGASTGLRRLALAGGVALNCTANGRLMRSGLFDEIYIQPAAGDDGSALGAALYRAALARDVRNVRFPSPFHGPTYSMEKIEVALAEFEDRVDVIRYRTLV